MEDIAISDPFDHLIFVISMQATRIATLIACLHLEVELLKHALVKDERLVVWNQQSKETSKHSCIATHRREQSDKVTGSDYSINVVLRLAPIDPKVAKSFVFLVNFAEGSGSSKLKVKHLDVKLVRSVDVAFDKKGEVTQVDEPVIEKSQWVLDYSELHRLNKIGHQVCGKALSHHRSRSSILTVLFGIKILWHNLVCNSHLVDDWSNSIISCAFDVSVRGKSRLFISCNCHRALVYNHDKVLALVKQERVVVDIELSQVWTDPIWVAELFFKKLIGLDLFGVDIAAASTWQKGESEVIFVTDRRVKLDASDFPGLYVTIPDVELCGKSRKVGIDLELVEVSIEIGEHRLVLLIIVWLDEQVNELLHTVDEDQ